MSRPQERMLGSEQPLLSGPTPHQSEGPESSTGRLVAAGGRAVGQGGEWPVVTQLGCPDPQVAGTVLSLSLRP